MGTKVSCVETTNDPLIQTGFLPIHHDIVGLNSAFLKTMEYFNSASLAD